MKADLKVSIVKNFAFGLAHPSLGISAGMNFNYKGLFDPPHDPSFSDCELASDNNKSLSMLIRDYVRLWESVAFSGAIDFVFYDSHKAFLSSPFLPEQLAVKLIAAMVTADSLEVSTDKLVLIDSVIEKAKSFLPGGQNPLHFLKAASEIGLPWKIISRDNNFVIQYGEGARLRLMTSSMSELDSPIGTRIVSNKAITTQYLKRLGYPVQPHVCVNTIAQALKFASNHYPVVVKPVNAERGEGVEVDIRDERELRIILQVSLKKYKSIIVEKYISAVDYRLYVFQGQLVWAHRRVPPSLMGDGTSTILELLNAENVKRFSSRSNLKSIPENRNFFQCLQDQGLKSDDILAVGDVCKVGSLGLVARGGHTEACYDEVHPDNAKLAVDCCKQLGICLGGVDLLMQDISVPWHNSVAHICEINSRPQLGSLTQSHLYGLILTRLIENGCIPSILIILDSKSPIYQSVVQRLSLLSSQVGFYFSYSQRAQKSYRDPFLDRRVFSCVALMNFEELHADGAPLSSFSQVCVDREILSSMTVRQIACLDGYCRGESVVEFNGEKELIKMILPTISLLSQGIR